MNTLPSELNHPAIALEPAAATTADAPAETSAPAAPSNSIPLISAFSTGTQRQLELTVNAMSRSVRKAIRHAERLERDGNYAEAATAWQQVNKRTAMLQDLARTFTTAVAVTVVVAPETQPQQSPQPQPQAEPAAPTPVAASAEPILDLREEEARINALLDELNRYTHRNDLDPFATNTRDIAIDNLKTRIREACLQNARRPAAGQLMVALALRQTPLAPARG